MKEKKKTLHAIKVCRGKYFDLSAKYSGRSVCYINTSGTAHQMRDKAQQILLKPQDNRFKVLHCARKIISISTQCFYTTMCVTCVSVHVYSGENFSFLPVDPRTGWWSGLVCPWRDTQGFLRSRWVRWTLGDRWTLPRHRGTEASPRTNQTTPGTELPVIWEYAS